MILGITNKDKTIRGKSIIKEIKIGGNKTTSVIINNYIARANDKIIYQCDKCKKEITVGKRLFFSTKVDQKKHLCCKCQTEKTCLIKYGVNSHNKSKDIKRKQHKKDREYVDGNENELRKPKTKNKKDLSKLRKQNAKKLWEKGIYDDQKYTEEFKKELKEKRKWENRKTKSNEELSKLRSKNAKKLWKSGLYDNTDFAIKRVSKFQLKVFNSLKGEWKIEYPIQGKEKRYFVDIVNLRKKIIIECFGDYWHCNPNKYIENYYHQRVHKTAKEIWAQDENRIKELEQLGYKVIIIWESDNN